MKAMHKAEIVICGAGIIGMTIARALLSNGHKNIIVIDKEKNIASHASGRNSGVLHAGIYYAPGSLRAKSCLSGNFQMKEFCREKGIPVRQNGKVIVAREKSELETLYELYARATENGAKVEIIDEKQLAEIEPNAKTCSEALFSHYTAVVDPKLVMQALYAELKADKNIDIQLGNAFINADPVTNTIVTERGDIKCDLFINASGAYSDKVARWFGFSQKYKLIPFKGIYKKLKKGKEHLVNGSIYPVPNIKNPFLGIHFTKGASGDVYLGPTAIPAFGRENYGLLSGMDIGMPSILFQDMVLFFKNEKFRRIALDEPKKYFFSHFYSDARRLVKKIDPSDIENSPKVGIRPQLINCENNSLMMDFVVENDKKSIHILNSISPAFTGSMFFADMVIKNYIG
jgi:L-2-hydroxyglutarate oxidase LhgO